MSVLREQLRTTTKSGLDETESVGFDGSMENKDASASTGQQQTQIKDEGRPESLQTNNTVLRTHSTPGSVKSTNKSMQPKEDPAYHQLVLENITEEALNLVEEETKPYDYTPAKPR